LAVGPFLPAAALFGPINLAFWLALWEIATQRFKAPAFQRELNARFGAQIFTLFRFADQCSRKEFRKDPRRLARAIVIAP
jgi:hypothetical protein